MIDYLIAKSAFGVGCQLQEGSLLVGILAVRERVPEANLLDPATGDRYRVHLNLQPGCYFSKSLELIHESATIQNY